MKKPKISWEKTNDYYNREVVTDDVWSKKVSRGKVYLIDGGNFQFTFSVGANSDNSYTGSFYGTSVTTLQEAKDYLDKLIPLHLAPYHSYDHKKIIELSKTIEKI